MTTLPRTALHDDCFVSGTRLRTAMSDVRVEDVRPGTILATGRGGVRRVRWIGSRAVELARHPRRDAVDPILVHADAFGPGLPLRDLRLSPDHCVCVVRRGELRLVRVGALVNGRSIVRQSPARVTYWHVELADEAGAAVHDVVLAEGLPCESYLDTGNRHAFADSGALTMAHPTFGPGPRSVEPCARLMIPGLDLEVVRGFLGRQARGSPWRNAVGLPGAGE